MSSFVALGYVGMRSSATRVATLLRQPAQLLVGLAVLTATVVLLSLGDSEITGFEAPAASIGALVVSMFLVVAIVLTLVVSSMRSPLRLRGPDVTWLFPVPAGGRGIVAYRLLIRLVTVFAAALVATVIAAVDDGGTFADAVLGAAGFALLAGALRGFSYVVYFMAIHGLPLWVPRAFAAGLVGVPLARFYFFTPDPWSELGSSIVQSSEFVLRPLAYLVRPLFATVSADGLAGPLLALAGLYVFVALVATALATGYQDATARITFEQESMTAAMSGVRPSDIAFGKATTVGTLDKLTGLDGDWAFAWRAVAQLRREARQELLANAVLAALSAATAVWLPGLALVPIALVVVGGVARAILEGMAEELGRSHVIVIPGSARTRFLAVSAVPAIRFLAAFEMVWLPVLVAAPLPLDLRVGVAVLGLPLAALVAAANSLAAVAMPTTGLRLGLSALVAGGGAALAGAVWWQLASTAVLGVGAACIVLALAGYAAIRAGWMLMPISGAGRPWVADRQLVIQE